MEDVSVSMNISSVASDIFLEFLEVAIHSILYSRKLYPTAIFQKRKKYNIPVFMSVHPDVNQYIENCLSQVKKLVVEQLVERVTIAVFDKSHKPIEKFVIEVELPDKTLSGKIENEQLSRLERVLRAFCLKINVCEELLNPLPKDCSFEIQIQSYGDPEKFTSLDNSQYFPWTEAEKKEIEIQESHIVPLKSTDHDLFKMQLFVEVSKTIAES